MAHPSYSLLDVPCHPQKSDGYCLPACVQMVLDHLGLPYVQEQLARELDVLRPLWAWTSKPCRSWTLQEQLLDGGADGALPIAQKSG